MDVPPIKDGPLALSQTQVFRHFSRQFDISAKRVLEIGGCVPAELTRAARQWWSVDPRHENNVRQDHVYRIRGHAEDLPASIRDVDLVFACNSFQHVRRLGDCYAAVAGVLRSGGTLYARFGPVWSAPDGAHFENVRFPDRRYDFWRGALVPSWSHLVLDASHFRAMAVELHGRSAGRALADYVERSTWINRLTLRDHVELPQRAGLAIRSLRGARRFGYRYAPPPPPDRCGEALSISAVARFAKSRLGLSPSHLAVRDIELVLTQAS
jgi:SAM-dependent methyltransferase